MRILTKENWDQLHYTENLSLDFNTSSLVA